jgi:hypothetical protein
LHPDDHDFIAQIFAHLVELVDESIELRSIVMRPILPPLLKGRTLLQLVVEDIVRLAQKIAEIGNADIEQGVRGNTSQQIARVPELWCRNLIDPMLKRAELRAQGKILVEIATPCDLLIDWPGV